MIVSGTAQLLLMDLDKGSPAHEKFTKIKAQVDRMGDITKKLMPLNRVETREYAGSTQILAFK